MTGRAAGRPGTPILAVEDEARNAALLRAILGPAGYDLTIAASLAEARAAVGTRTPALVLLDRHLPDGDGLSLARELRAVRNDRRDPDPARQRERAAGRPDRGRGGRLRGVHRQAGTRRCVARGDRAAPVEGLSEGLRPGGADRTMRRPRAATYGARPRSLRRQDARARDELTGRRTARHGDGDVRPRQQDLR